MDATSQFGTWASAWGAVSGHSVRVRLSKIVDYLVDNVCCNRLSELGHAVNAKASLRTQASGEKKSQVSKTESLGPRVGQS